VKLERLRASAVGLVTPGAGLRPQLLNASEIAEVVNSTGQ
jgi:hypothetical protein